MTLDLKPLSARSIALSLLLGAQPPQLPGNDLVAAGELFDVAGSTMRVALSRMVASGDVTVQDGIYSLTARHLQRHQKTSEVVHPHRRPYDGTWRALVVVDRGRSLQQRTTLRRDLTHLRFAELREGVWMRPDNLDRPDVPAEVRGFDARPDDARGLCAELWDLDGWAEDAHELVGHLRDTTARPIERLTAAAAVVRLLRTDPVLPDELMPAHWPAAELRWLYEEYRHHLSTSHLLGQVHPLQEAR